MPFRVLALSGSLRRASHSTAVLRAAAEAAPDGVVVDVRTLHDVPLYDADLAPVPDAVVELKAALAAADGVLIATPEYNHSIPGVLKNALDWVSRPAFAGPLVGKAVAVVSSSPGALGGARAQAHLKDVLLALGAHVVPGREVVLSNVDRRIAADGSFANPADAAFVATRLREVVDLARRLGTPADRA